MMYKLFGAVMSRLDVPEEQRRQVAICVDEFQTFVAKDQSGSGEGGHFRIASDHGRLYLRFADGDGGSNYEWRTATTVFDEGQWTHVAVSFDSSGSPSR